MIIHRSIRVFLRENGLNTPALMVFPGTEQKYRVTNSDVFNTFIFADITGALLWRVSFGTPKMRPRERGA